ncbi:MAG: hypothetical protein J7M10_02425 [Candidatus Cloacimonetes bacterium]|nr:hypothetical protein [Candidatus Cloacimonadota bacterium]
MNCLKCGQLLDTGLKCWGCGTQYELIEESNTSEFINYPIALPSTADDYYPKKEDIEWEY